MPRESASVGQGCGLETCISPKFPGDADVLQVAPVQTTVTQVCAACSPASQLPLPAALWSRATQAPAHSRLLLVISIYRTPGLVLSARYSGGGLILFLKMKNRPRELNFVCSFVFPSIYLSIQQMPAAPLSQALSWVSLAEEIPV